MNFDGISLPLPLLLLHGRGKHQRWRCEILPKDSIRIPAFMHLTKARAGRGRERRWKEGGEKKGGGGCNLLFKHSCSDLIVCDEVRAENKELMVPLS